MPNKTLALLLVVILVAAGTYLYIARERVVSPNPNTESSILSEPTDFSAIGTITAPSPTSGQTVMSFTYSQNGATTTTLLALDALSVCAAPNGATPCMAMSITFDIPFNNKRAVIEGSRVEGQDAILVRKLMVLADNEPAYTPETGQVFVSWPNAQTIIKSCDASMVSQTHALDVYITRKDGSRVRAVESIIDEVFRVIDEARVQCGAIPVATE